MSDRAKFVVGASALGGAVVLFAASLLFKRSKISKLTACEVAKLTRLRSGIDLDSESGVYFNSKDAPDWLKPLFSDNQHKRVLFREWEDIEWRTRNGWSGRDLIHDANGRGVLVHAYFWNASTKVLTGIVRFGPDAESHRGLCHGGAMTSLMDDLCGHIAFFDSKGPWSGATVQVDVKLSKPVRIGDVLKLVGQIDERAEPNKRGLQKVHVSARLLGEDGVVYCELKGLTISGFSMHTIDDGVAARTWLDEDRVLRDSGWLLP